MRYQRKEQVMKKGFTLIELMIVIIIIGILATVGIVQYQAAVEKSRGAEAKSILGFLHQQCASVYMETGDANDCPNRINLGGANTNIPNACRPSHWFFYTFTANSATTATIRATRCIAAQNGKTPPGTAANQLDLTSDFATGSSSFVAQTVY
jgi:prepilin-type N-terminal cleavage/methylation domain-containing protein